MGPIFAIVLSLLAIFLILLVLVQRGRGGGLAGALGGMGGSSAFGAKAGDVFTRITIYTASVWIALCLFALFWAKHKGDALGSGSTSSPSSSEIGTLPGEKTSQPGGTATETKDAATTGPALPEIPSTNSTSAPPVTTLAAPPTSPADDATNKDAPPAK
jgi:preprotein translocase subunit SecG